MTRNDFVFICNEYSILPSIVLEDNFVRKILKDDNGKSSIKNELLLSTYIKENF
jgi:hypothetical protein